LSDESGRQEIYIAPFPGPGGRKLVSVAGGDLPRWRKDGKELFYLASEGLMAAEVSVRGAEVEIGAVRPLSGPLHLLPSTNSYDVSPDGQRFLVIEQNEQSTPEPLTLVQNWAAGLKK
jgi:Tol biopolymer transport system component